MLGVLDFVRVDEDFLGLGEEVSVSSPIARGCGFVDDDISPAASDSIFHEREDKHDFVLIVSEHIFVRRGVEEDLTEE